MERYPKLFILAAVGYLLAGVMLGLAMGLLPATPYITRFVHVHLNLLGFMAMFIYGVAYHILPRFNAKPLAYPNLVKVHFYLVNAGLIGMCGFALGGGLAGGGISHAGFAISAIMEAIGIFIFAFNLAPILMPEKELPDEPEEEVVPEETLITGETKTSALLDEFPALAVVFDEVGLKALTSIEARASFAKNVTISQASKIHKIDESEFIEKLNSADKLADPNGAGVHSPLNPSPQKKAETAMAKGDNISKGELAKADTLIGSLIEVYPETKPVFEKHYGSGCFSCPGQAFETLSQTAVMHGMKAEDILKEVNDIIESVNGS